MNRYDLLLNKTKLVIVKETGQDHPYFMGISSKEGKFLMIVGHVEKLKHRTGIIFKKDVEFECPKNNLHSDLLNFYLAKKNLRIRIRDSLENEFLLNYFFDNFGIQCSVVSIDDLWKDRIGSISRFFNITHDTIIPENSYDSFLLALSLVVDAIEIAGKSTLIASVA